MHTRPYPRLAMLGAAPETRGSIATLIDSYRAHGLFSRWPIEYLATHGHGGPARNAALLLRSLRGLGMLVTRHRRLAVHLHTGARGFVRDAVFMSAALAARCPLLVHLHGAGFERRVPPALARFFFERAACVITPCESARLRFAPERTLPRLEEIYAALGLAAAGERARAILDLKKAA